MNTHPILFSAPMVRAILDGSKTQTRRPIKGIEFLGGQGDESDPVCWGLEDAAGEFWTLKKDPHLNDPRGDRVIRCPYGQPGDLLWVRETTEADEETCDSVILSRYIADKSPVLYSGSEDPEYDGSIAHWDYPRLARPSIHMPRWASRLTLEITDVRVERVESISEGDAIREGLERRLGMMPEYRGSPDLPWRQEFPRDAFRELWDSINAKRGYGWDVNPWVWALTFKAHQMNVDAMLRVAA